MRQRCVYKVLARGTRYNEDEGEWGELEHGWLIAILMGTAMHYVIAKEDGYLRRFHEAYCELQLVPEDTQFPEAAVRRTKSAEQVKKFNSEMRGKRKNLINQKEEEDTPFPGEEKSDE